MIPQLLGSAFNIWYNSAIIGPLLATPILKRRFVETIIIYNGVIYPIGIWLWLKCVLSLAACIGWAPSSVGNRSRNADASTPARHPFAVVWPQLISQLPGCSVSRYFLARSGRRMVFSTRVYSGTCRFRLASRHLLPSRKLFSWSSLPVIAELFPIFFHDTRRRPHAGRAHAFVARQRRDVGDLGGNLPDRFPCAAFLCARASGHNAQWSAVFVGAVGIAFGLFSSIDDQRTCGQANRSTSVGRSIPLRAEISIFDLASCPGGRVRTVDRRIQPHASSELKDKEKLRQTFGLHVGKRAAEQILARDPGLNGVEEEITVMFVDIRSATARAGASSPGEMIDLLNDFFRVTVRVVEEAHGGMVNKYLGDGFMAIFGAGESKSNHAQDAVTAGREILLAVDALNRDLVARSREPLRIGIGIHSGPAIVGSIGSPQRLEFTAIGNAVNIASRIESLTKTVGRPMLITEAVRDRLRDQSGLEELPRQQIRGVRDSVLVFAPQSEV